MKTVIITLASLALATTALAQLTPLPPSSATDGVLVKPIGLNAGATHWDSTATLGSFKPANATDGNAQITSVIYNPIGLPFAAAMPANLQNSLNALNAGGGFVRAIFLAESALWKNSFGYTRTGLLTGPGRYTAFAEMSSEPSVGPVNVAFGNHIDVNLAAGAASTFDFWFHGDGAVGADYALFHPAVGMDQMLWAQNALAVNTWIPSLGSYMDVSTYLVGLEDWRPLFGSDRDYSDAVIGFQFFSASGTPITPVPEPGTFGLIGAVACLGLVIIRRFRSGKNGKAAA